MATQQIVVTAADPIAFVKEILKWGEKGATLKDRTFPRLKGLPYAVELEIETDKNIPSTPLANVLPIPTSAEVYTKEELEALEWSVFKKVCKSLNIGGRDRVVMTTQYLKAVAEKE